MKKNSNTTLVATTPTTRAKVSVNFKASKAILGITLLFAASTVVANEIPNSIDYTMYKLATENNDTSAQYFIGRKFYLGTKVTENKEEAAKWFEMAALKEHKKAQFMLGKMYMYGEGIPKNAQKAEELLTKAANKDLTDAQFELGNFYYFGYSGKKDIPQAIKWYKAAAKERNSQAQLQLGKIYFGGMGINADKEEGKKWLELAYDNGLPEAREYLNAGGSSDKQKKPASTASAPKENSRIKKEIAQAEIGNVDSQYSLGIRYLKGDGIEKNPKNAVTWVRKAAEQDHAGAQYQLGVMYRDGVGVSKSESEAIKWLRLASSWGIAKAQKDLDALLRKQLLASEDEFTANPELSNPDSQYTLGVMYVDGKGVEKDPSTALQWFLKAARQNHSEAQFRVGEMYKDGIGVMADPKEAKIWLAKAADSGLSKASQVLKEFLDAEDKRILSKEVETLRNSPIYPYLLSAKKGDTQAKYQVGIMYLEGDDTPKDTIEGVRWLQSAAIGNHTLAQLKLGELYLNGTEKIEQDYMAAFKWLKKAADSGEADAQYYLGDIYRKGLGVEKSNAEAVKWFRLAAKQGHSKARKQLGGCKIC